MPWFHISNSGCCALSTGAPVSACVQSLNLLLVVVGEDVLDLQPVRPRIDEPLLRPFEVILHVALAADEAAHLLSRGVAIHVVILHALRWL